jgi:hypothetical protein
MNVEPWLLAVSGAALLVSILAFRSARMARLAALRTEVRWELGNAVADARWLLDKAVTLTEDTMKAAYELRAAEGSGFRPDEREAFDLRDDARLPLAELQQINPDMTGKSRKQLEAIRREVTRIRRAIDETGTKIDVKNAALDSLLERTPAGGDAPRRRAVFTSANPDARPGKSTP